MDDAQPVIALDIVGPIATCLIGVKSSGAALEVLGGASAHCPGGLLGGVVINIKSLAATIASVTSQAEKTANVRIGLSPILIGIRGSHLRSVKLKRRQRSTSEEVTAERTVLHSPAFDAAQAVTASRAHLQNIRSACQEAKRTPGDMVYSILGLAEALALPREAVALVNVEPRSTSIGIFVRGSLWRSDEIPAGVGFGDKSDALSLAKELFEFIAAGLKSLRNAEKIGRVILALPSGHDRAVPAIAESAFGLRVEAPVLQPGLSKINAPFSARPYLIALGLLMKARQLNSKVRGERSDPGNRNS